MDQRSAMYKFYEEGKPLNEADKSLLSPVSIDTLRTCAEKIVRTFGKEIENNERIRFVFDFRGDEYRVYTISGENKEVV